MLKVHIAQTTSEKKYNEDTFCYGNNYAMVLDGASGLDQADRMHTGSDARWFVVELQKEIQKHINDDKQLSFIVSDAIQTLIPLYPSVEKSFMPSGCLSLFRIHDGKAEYIGFGDTVAIIETKEKTYCLYDHAIERLDHIAIEAMQKSQLPFAEARESVKDILIKNRTFRNIPNGYCALDLSMDSFAFCIKKSWNIEDVKSVALMSDGFYQLKEFLHQKDDEFLQTLGKQKEKTLPLLYSLQEQDWPCLQLPRLKKRDDTTILFFSL